MRRPWLPPSVLAGLLLAGAGCASGPSSKSKPVAARNYPSEPPSDTVSPAERDENPSSQVWPLDLWLVEFGKRNGVELRYRDQDTFNRSVVRPGPGPYDSDSEATSVLRQVCSRNGLLAVEERRHVFTLKRRR